MGKLAVDINGWIIWRGGSMPQGLLPSDKVTVRLSNGNEGTDFAGFWNWSHGLPSSGANVIAYKKVSSHL
jgi:hypothetical protein